MDHRILEWVAYGLIGLAVLSLMGLLIRRGGGDSLEVGDMVSAPSPEPRRSPVGFILVVALAGVASWVAWGQHGPINLPHSSASSPSHGNPAHASGSFWDFLGPRHRNNRGGDEGGNKDKPAGSETSPVDTPPPASPAAPGDAPQNARWARQPSLADIVAAYPAAARDKPVTGNVMLQCASDSAGRMQGCRVLDETPSGQGFGDAALSLVPRYRLAAASLSSLNGRSMTIIVRFPPPS